MTNRVHIDAPAGVIEIEGEKEFVQSLLDKLFPLLEDAKFGSRPQQSRDHQSVEIAEEMEDGLSEEDSKSDKSKVKRKRISTPKGHSCADRIMSLKDDGFFKTHRGNSEIIKGLAANGFTHKANQVAAAGESLFKRGLLQRTKDGNGPFKYYWDRD